MTPLEIAVNAMWDYANDGGSDLRPPDGPTNSEREHYRQKVRAALLALAEADLPEMVMDAGALASGLRPDGANLSAFRAMLRAIAEEST
mgnify:CR=1 FL=1